MIGRRRWKRGKDSEEKRGRREGQEREEGINEKKM